MRFPSHTFPVIEKEWSVHLYLLFSAVPYSLSFGNVQLQRYIDYWLSIRSLRSFILVITYISLTLDQNWFESKNHPHEKFKVKKVKPLDK